MHIRGVQGNFGDILIFYRLVIVTSAQQQCFVWCIFLLEFIAAVLIFLANIVV